MEVNDAEKALQKESFEVIWKDDDGKVQKANRIVMELVGSRRENKQVKEYEYEVKYRDGAEGYLTLKTLTKRGWKKAADAIDARIAQRSGQYTRTLSSGTILNLRRRTAINDRLIFIYTDLKFHELPQPMSRNILPTAVLIPNSPPTTAWVPYQGARKLRVSWITICHRLFLSETFKFSQIDFYFHITVVLAAAMWNQPHILILDEPTNYLDRESLGALANAITAFEGGVVIISHNNEFVSTLCPEEWVMDAGNLTTKGEVGWMNRQDDKISDAPVITEMTDALGNTSEVKQAKKAVSKRDEKALLKALRKKIAQNEELDEAEEEMAIANDLL